MTHRLPYPPPHPARDVRVDWRSGAEVPASGDIWRTALRTVAFRLQDRCDQSDLMTDDDAEALRLAELLLGSAQVPAEEIAVTSAMIEAWWDIFHRSRIISDSIISMGYRAMERARRAEASLTFGPEWRQAKMAAYNNGELIPIEQPRPPGYRSASEDEPERDGDAGMRK